MAIPVYVFAGFLESGKTSFIASILQDPGFTRDEHTLVIQCEQGMEEFEPAMLKETHTEVEYVEDEDEFDAELLYFFVKRHQPDRVILEMNGMWDLDAALGNLPGVMEVYQLITTINAETFELYSMNMGQRMIQHISAADMIVFNRATEKTRELIRGRNIRSMNVRASIYFENDDGTSEDYGEGMPPPYDLDADVIDIQDEWFGVFYLHAQENPEMYDGKTVRFKGFIYHGKKLGKDEFVPGRMGMVCCANDMRFVGFICKAGEFKIPKERTWQMITARIRIEEREEYRGPGPVLYLEDMSPAEPPVEETVMFNY